MSRGSNHSSYTAEPPVSYQANRQLSVCVQGSDCAGLSPLALTLRVWGPPMFLAFDYPIPFSTIGKRSVSNVPAQALTLLNNPFVVEQADVWAKRVLSEQGKSAEQRIGRMYLTAFGRPPLQRELEETLAFVQDEARHYGSADDSRIWSNLGHVLFNVKEFIFVQ